ncbi:hypothetical protein J6590_015014 [Homalodisca vitripennis]|nr:hypothetical protein J6590_015014 [Homalodisca vitripennis]
MPRCPWLTDDIIQVKTRESPSPSGKNSASTASITYRSLLSCKLPTAHASCLHCGHTELIRSFCGLPRHIRVIHAFLTFVFVLYLLTSNAYTVTVGCRIRPLVLEQDHLYKVPDRVIHAFLTFVFVLHRLTVNEPYTVTVLEQDHLYKVSDRVIHAFLTFVFVLHRLTVNEPYTVTVGSRTRPPSVEQDHLYKVSDRVIHAFLTFVFVLHRLTVNEPYTVTVLEQDHLYEVSECVIHAFLAIIFVQYRWTVNEPYTASKTTREEKSESVKCNVRVNILHFKCVKEEDTNITKEYLKTILDYIKKEVFAELSRSAVKWGAQLINYSIYLIRWIRRSSLSEKENEKLRVEHDEMSNTVIELRERVRTLEQYTRRNNIEISGRGEGNTVIKLRERVRTLEQYTRRNNIEISGVPVTAQDHVMTLVKVVGKATLNGPRSRNNPCEGRGEGNTVIKLRERVRTLEQYTRRNNIEISGVPVTAQESWGRQHCNRAAGEGANSGDVMSLGKYMGRALEVEVLDNHIEAAHRVPSYNSKREPSLVVQFQSRKLKDAWISKSRDEKTITAAQANIVFSNQTFYVNDHLSPDNRRFISKLKRRDLN